MKPFFTFFTFLISLISYCQMNPMSLMNPMDKLEKYPLKSIEVYGKDDRLFKASIFKYDERKRLISRSIIKDGVEINRTDFYYDDYNFLVYEEQVAYLEYPVITRRKYYEYDENRKLIREWYDDDSGENAEYTYIYDKRGWISEIQVFHNNRYVNKYFFDSEHRIRKLIDQSNFSLLYTYPDEYTMKETYHNEFRTFDIVYEYGLDGLARVYSNGMLIKEIYIIMVIYGK